MFLGVGFELISMEFFCLFRDLELEGFNRNLCIFSMSLF